MHDIYFLKGFKLRALLAFWACLTPYSFGSLVLNDENIQGHFQIIHGQMTWYDHATFVGVVNIRVSSLTVLTNSATQ